MGRGDVDWFKQRRLIASPDAVFGQYLRAKH
jgi:hypothetical protein